MTVLLADFPSGLAPVDSNSFFATLADDKIYEFALRQQTFPVKDNDVPFTHK